MYINIIYIKQKHRNIVQVEHFPSPRVVPSLSWQTEWPVSFVNLKTATSETPGVLNLLNMFFLFSAHRSRLQKVFPPAAPKHSGNKIHTNVITPRNKLRK